QGQLVVDLVGGAHAHVIKRQKIEPKRARIVQLVFGVISFDSDRASKFADIQRQSVADGRHVRSISLKDISIDIRAGFIGGISLQRVRRLPELQIEANSKRTSSANIGSPLENHVGLIQTDVVAQNVVGTQRVHTPNRVVEIERIIFIEREIQSGSVQVIKNRSIRG